MATFSLVVPAYNVEHEIGRCLSSIRVQTFTDFEVIVVDDCSTDNTPAEIEKAIFQDPRFLVIRHEENKGLHLARKTGVAAARGKYLLFLDGDDEITQNYFEQLAQGIEGQDAELFHVGITVLNDGVTEGERASFEKAGNRKSEPMQGAEISHLAFNEEAGYQMDWRVTSRVFKTDFAKRAFDHMVFRRLERAEDAYEMFVCCALNPLQLPLESARGYLYHFGGGISGSSTMSPQKFERNCAQFEECLNAVAEFIQNPSYSHLEADYQGLRNKLHEQIGTDFLYRVADADKSAAIAGAVKVCGAAVFARELWRHVRDAYYALLVNDYTDADVEHARMLALLAQSAPVLEASVSDFDRFDAMRFIARSHKQDFDRAVVLQTYEEQPVKIFVTTHKDVDVPQGAVHQPVQVGAGLKNNRFMWAYHDDEGDSIESKNPMYCEMTVQYWAWKNALKNASYVGFCHYRRYFNFSGTHYEENPYGEVIDDYIDADAVHKYGLDDKSVLRAVEGYDVITTGFHDLRDMPGHFSTPREHYAQAPLLHLEDIDRMVGIIARLYPDYVADARAFLNGHKSCFCNMYIMRTEIFERYCEWLFPILDAYTVQTDMTTYSKEALRTPGHLAERLFNIYYLHAQRTHVGWKTKELQCVHFERPDGSQPLLPLIDIEPKARGRQMVPVVFASDDNYVPMLATTVYSMLANANPKPFYDVVVLERNISPQRKAMLEDMVAAFDNARIRFVDVQRRIEGYDLSTNNEHISLETYYRFLVQEILGAYNKVLYLDCDLVVEGDVYELFSTDLGTNLLAAAHDIDYLGNLNMNDGERMRYTTQVLGLKHPYDYFQAGVLVLNTAELRKLHSVEEWMQIVSEANYIYDDQDILNKECQGRVTYLPFNWNVMHDCGGRVGKVFVFAPNDTFDAYMVSRANPQIIHYAGFEKPWVNLRADFAVTYWRYARQTPFYEEFIGRIAEAVRPAPAPQPAHPLVDPSHEKAIPANSPIRRYVDPLMPVGTKRREVFKSLGRGLQGKK